MKYQAALLLGPLIDIEVEIDLFLRCGGWFFAKCVWYEGRKLGQSGIDFIYAGELILKAPNDMWKP